MHEKEHVGRLSLNGRLHTVLNDNACPELRVPDSFVGKKEFPNGIWEGDLVVQVGCRLITKHMIVDC